MIGYILGFMMLLSLLRGVRLVLIKRKYRDQKADPKVKEIYHKRGKIGILLIHGFTSSPLDFKPMAEYLAKRNITVLAPLLKGHGTSPENLATTTDEDWFKSVEDAYHRLRKEVKYVFAAGHSLGGNFAVPTAAQQPVDGFISLAMPIFFRKYRFFRVAAFTVGLFKLFQKKRYTRDFLKRVNPKRFVYTRIPFNCTGFVVRAVNRSIEQLKNIRCPILIMQPEEDSIVNERSVDFLYKKVGSKKKKIVWLSKTHHVFLLDKEHRDEAFNEIYQFIKENAV